MALLGAAFVALVGLAVMGLWNWLMPALFGLGTIGWCQALGLLLLSKILFGGHGMGRRGCGQCGGGHRGAHWRSKWEAKWEKMTPEQRAKFKDHWGNKCGPGNMGKMDDSKANATTEHSADPEA